MSLHLNGRHCIRKSMVLRSPRISEEPVHVTKSICFYPLYNLQISSNFNEPVLSDALVFPGVDQLFRGDTSSKVIFAALQPPTHLMRDETKKLQKEIEVFKPSVLTCFMNICVCVCVCCYKRTSCNARSI